MLSKQKQKSSCKLANQDCMLILQNCCVFSYHLTNVIIQLFVMYFFIETRLFHNKILFYKLVYSHLVNSGDRENGPIT